jgi:hypothetical protein
MANPTLLTSDRRRFLEAFDHDYRQNCCLNFRNPENAARAVRLAPKRRAAWDDMTGRALQSLRDWLAGECALPMTATVKEVRAALAGKRDIPQGRRDVYRIDGRYLGAHVETLGDGSALYDDEGQSIGIAGDLCRVA